MFCSKCGNELSEGDKFCNKCGASISNNNSKINNKKVAIIVLIFSIAIIALVIYCNMNNSKENVDIIPPQNLYSENSNNNSLEKENQIKNTVSVAQNDNFSQPPAKKTVKEQFEEYGYVECKLEFKNNINNIVDNFNNINYTNINSEVEYSIYYMRFVIGEETYDISSLYFNVLDEYQVRLFELNDIMMDTDNNILYIKKELYDKIQNENGKLKTTFTVRCRGIFNYEVETSIKKDQINIVEINEEDYYGAVFG